MTMESPVCTPNGSKFSMLHTVIQLSSWSRTTSYSTSFQPSIDFSMSNWGETASAFVASVLNSSAFWQMPTSETAESEGRARHQRVAYFVSCG